MSYADFINAFLPPAPEAAPAFEDPEEAIDLAHALAGAPPPSPPLPLPPVLTGHVSSLPPY